METFGVGTSAQTFAIEQSRQRVQLALFSSTIFLSALLLFAVQPMFAKMVLPVLGGSPSVWAVSMCFFQAVLLGGYCYAHVLNRLFSQKTGLMIHLGVLAAGALALPVALPAFASEPPTGNAYVWLMTVLAAGVGLPFFAVSANSPLLQAWFAQSGHKDAADPYFLYAASNIGSLLALLSYPIVIEPLIGVSAQAGVWTLGFALLAAAIAACGVSIFLSSRADSAAEAVAAPIEAAAITWPQRASWIALAFIPSALLTAFTTFLSTDIGSAPFLWVLPLSFFLLTFVLVFRDQPVISHEALLDRQPLAAALAIFGTASVAGSNWYIGLAGSIAAFVLTTLVAHRELYLRRPAASALTEFYLWMSFGGVLGGVFAALIAPQLFTSIFEFPLVVALGLLARPAFLAAVRTDDAERKQALLWIAGGIALLVLVDQAIAQGLFAGHFKLRIGAIALFIGLMFVMRRRVLVETAAFALMLAAALILPEGGGSSHTVRSFFGVHRVVTTPDGTMRLLMHGTTTHGARRIKTDTGAPVTTPVPATYYYAGSPMAHAVGIARDHVSGAHAFTAGIVGLGTGAIGCYKRPGETWSFYEIDQAVVDIARDPDAFGFMTTCQPDARVTLGDARLTIAREAPHSFDYLLIDAFSSDAIPTHLMTMEALQLYDSKLREGGVLAVHISNKHLDLAPMLAAEFGQMPGMQAVIVADQPASPGYDQAPSRVVVASKSESAIKAALALPGAQKLLPGDVDAWTDDYSNILAALLRGWRHQPALVPSIAPPGE